MAFVMNYGSYVLVPIHVLVCLILVAVVLLQTGKGTDWAGVFGGQGTQTAFGPRGVENTLSRLTKVAAVVFMVTSLSISILQSRAQRGVFDSMGLPSRSDRPAAAPAAGSTPAASPAPAGSTPAASPAETTPGEGAAAPAPAAGSPEPATAPAAGSAPAAGPTAASPTP